MSPRKQSLMDYYSLQQIAANCLLCTHHTPELAHEIRKAAMRLRCEAELTDPEIQTGNVREFNMRDVVFPPRAKDLS